MTGEAVTLADVAELQVGFAFKSSEFTTDPSHSRLLRGDNIGQGDTRWDQAAHWPLDGVDERYVLAEGDLVIAMDRPWIGAGLKYASISAMDLPAFLVQRVARLRARPGIDQRYLHYVVGGAAFTEHILAMQTGTAIPHVSGSQILRFTTPVPALAEQRAIAEVLGALDDKIAANNRVIDTSQELMLAHGQEVTEQAKVAELARQSTASVKPQEFEAEVAHFSLPAFDEGAITDSAKGPSIKSNKFLLTAPCVLMSKLNPRIPRIWDVPVLPGLQSLASTEFVVLLPIGLDASVLWSVLSQPSVSADLTAKVAGTSGSHQRFRPTELLELKIGDARTLRDSVRQSIADLGRLVQSRRDESVALAATRDELLPLLMSGKVRVKDAEEMVADAL